MIYTEQISQALARVGSVLPGAIATGTGAGNQTEAIDLSKYRRILFVADVGSLGLSGTAALQVLTATASGGTFTALTSYTSTTITATGVTETEFTNEGMLGLGLATQPTWIKGCLSVSTNAISASVAAWAGGTRYEPASKANVAYVGTPLVL